MAFSFLFIIVSVLNGEKTPGSCLNSIGVQTFTDFEGMVIDRGSTDRTGTILYDYESRLLLSRQVNSRTGRYELPAR
ncbi:glycosyltransferase [Larkinella soli]|uniref:glycosyltransferase n=1 Tax=Larkinella soli TaxID=1770527 RepID=UPI000FFC1649